MRKIVAASLGLALGLTARGASADGWLDIYNSPAPQDLTKTDKAVWAQCRTESHQIFIQARGIYGANIPDLRAIGYMRDCVSSGFDANNRKARQ
jgi:hypothetical protein